MGPGESNLMAAADKQHQRQQANQRGQGDDQVHYPLNRPLQK